MHDNRRAHWRAVHSRIGKKMAFALKILYEDVRLAGPNGLNRAGDDVDAECEDSDVEDEGQDRMNQRQMPHRA
jgi:hypothetical protein